MGACISKDTSIMTRAQSKSKTDSPVIPRVSSKLNISRPQPEAEPSQHEMDKDDACALRNHVAEIASQFDLDTNKLRFIQNEFIDAMRYGLGNSDGDLAMIPTFVTGRPTGEETGGFFAIDLGGSNLRICLVRLLGPEGGVDITQRKFVVPEDLKAQPASALFDYISGHVENFLLENKFQSNSKSHLPLGFTFSFPVNQTAIDRGKLVTWNKGFACAGAVGMDVVQLLQDALDRRLLSIKVTAMVNDTVGTLLASAYVKPNTLAGVILGTGTNAAYYEKLTDITKWRGDPGISDEMIVNVEWGNFDSQKTIIPCTVFDHRLDRETQNPYFMGLEKMISGRYLGELVRNIIIDLIDHRHLFKGRSSTTLNTKHQFLTSYMSDISADTSSRLDRVKHILEDIFSLPANSTTQLERECIQDICNFVARRSARLSATILAGLCAKRADLLNNDITVGIDGSLFEHHPSFGSLMESTLTELMGEPQSKKIHLTLARDGSGIGAALTAMIASL